MCLELHFYNHYKWKLHLRNYFTSYVLSIKAHFVFGVKFFSCVPISRKTLKDCESKNQKCFADKSCRKGAIVVTTSVSDSMAARHFWTLFDQHSRFHAYFKLSVFNLGTIGNKVSKNGGFSILSRQTAIKVAELQILINTFNKLAF